MKEFTYRIYDEIYDMMITKKKNREIRLYNEKSSSISIGDIITFIAPKGSIKVRVINLEKYESAEELYNNTNMSEIIDYDIKLDELKEKLYQIFGKEKVDESLILVIYFELI